MPLCRPPLPVSAISLPCTSVSSHSKQQACLQLRRQVRWREVLAILHYQAIFRLGVLPWQSLLSLHSTLHKIFEDACFHLLKCIFNWCHLATYPLSSVTEELNHYIGQCQTETFPSDQNCGSASSSARTCICNCICRRCHVATYALHFGTLQSNTLQLYTFHFAPFALCDLTL